MWLSLKGGKHKKSDLNFETMNVLLGFLRTSFFSGVFVTNYQLYKSTTYDELLLYKIINPHSHIPSFK